MKNRLLPGLLLAALVAAAPAQARNIVIFVADGLRYGSVALDNMPNMHALKTEGVDFTNSHSLFPTVTTVNASAIATGHYIGDTGNFGNTLWAGTPLISEHGSPIAGLEDDTVLMEMNQKFGGNYLGEDSLMARARAQGFNTAIIGKVGPARIQDLTAAADGSQTLILDDSTGSEGGFGLPAWFTREMRNAFVGGQAPKTTLPDYEQEIWLMKAATRIVLPHFAEDGKPFVLLFWSRDPDITQHGAADSVGEFTPGINGPSGLAAVRHADTQLGALRAALKEQGLDKDTDIFVTADHGFNTIKHDSATSPSAHYDPNRPLAELGSGFLAVDLASALHLRLYDPGRAFMPVDYSGGGKLSGGAGFIGDAKNPDVVVAPNGGADLVYIPSMDGKDLAKAKDLASQMVAFLLTQDYVSGVFVNDRLGRIPGALGMGEVNLMGDAKTPRPALVVNFRTDTNEGCTIPERLQCTVGIHDTSLKTGQGSHGNLSRSETRNFMAAVGPDFKAGYADAAPVSNADITPTLAQAAGIKLAPRGKLKGRVIAEALAGGAEPNVTRRTIVSDPGENGQRTILNVQFVGENRYFDAGGFAGRSVGLTPP